MNGLKILQGILINNQFPGPQIEAVTNDNLIINVFNKLNEPFLLSWYRPVTPFLTHLHSPVVFSPHRSPPCPHAPPLLLRRLHFIHLKITNATKGIYLKATT